MGNDINLDMETLILIYHVYSHIGLTTSKNLVLISSSFTEYCFDLDEFSF